MLFFLILCLDDFCKPAIQLRMLYLHPTLTLPVQGGKLFSILQHISPFTPPSKEFFNSVSLKPFHSTSKKWLFLAKLNHWSTLTPFPSPASGRGVLWKNFLMSSVLLSSLPYLPVQGGKLLFSSELPLPFSPHPWMESIFQLCITPLVPSHPERDTHSISNKNFHIWTELLTFITNITTLSICIVSFILIMC